MAAIAELRNKLNNALKQLSDTQSEMAGLRAEVYDLRNQVDELKKRRQPKKAPKEDEGFGLPG